MVECFRCAAASTNPKHLLRYQPVDETIIHDYQPPLKIKRQIDLAKSKQVKVALARERSSAKSIARTTLASGRLRHDGDAIHLDALRVERKTRFKTRSISVTSAELVKGKSQQIDVFEIDLALLNETYYVLTAQTYQDLISYVYQSSQPAT